MARDEKQKRGSGDRWHRRQRAILFAETGGAQRLRAPAVRLHPWKRHDSGQWGWGEPDGYHDAQSRVSNLLTAEDAEDDED